MPPSHRYTHVKGYHRRGHERRNPKNPGRHHVPPTDVHPHTRRVPLSHDPYTDVPEGYEGSKWRRKHVAVHRRPYEDRTIPIEGRPIYTHEEPGKEAIAKPRKNLPGGSMLLQNGYELDDPPEERREAIQRAMGAPPTASHRVPDWRKREVYRELLELRKYREDTEEAKEFHGAEEQSDAAEIRRVDEWKRVQDDQKYILDEYGAVSGMETGADYAPWVEESVVKYETDND